MLNSQVPVVILLGATACGKTSALLELSGFPIEVVSADSMQVYKGLDIGTAKPSLKERDRLVHHLVDIAEPSESFTAGNFVHLARNSVSDIIARGKIPVICGGCGFYIKNFVFGLPQSPPSDLEIREILKKELLEKGISALIEELRIADPISAQKIHPNDEYRVLRALEVVRLCGRPLSEFNMTGSGISSGNDFEFHIIGISRPKEELYERINERVDLMFEAGLRDEVAGLYERGFTPNDPALRGIGYREFFVEDYDCGAGFRLSQDLQGVKEMIAMNSRRYAKRQLTFFRAFEKEVLQSGLRINWIEGKGKSNANLASEIW